MEKEIPVNLIYLAEISSVKEVIEGIEKELCPQKTQYR